MWGNRCFATLCPLQNAIFFRSRQQQAAALQCWNGILGVKYFSLINLSYALYLSRALFCKNKRTRYIKTASSLLRFLTRKRTGVGLRYPSEPVQMCKKRTSTSSKRLIICPILSHRFSLYLHIFCAFESPTLNRIIFSFFKAAERRNTGSISSFANAEKRKKNRFKAWFG